MENFNFLFLLGGIVYIVVMSVHIREAGLADVSNLYALNKACLPVYYSEIEHGMMIMSPSQLVLVAYVGDKLVGYMIGEYQPGGNFHIVSIGVDKKCRGKGIGGHLLKKCYRKIGGYKTVSLNVHVKNNVAISFYEKNGFKIMDTMRGYYEGCLEDDNLDGYRMERRL